jgi:hypothetical protein
LSCLSHYYGGWEKLTSVRSPEWHTLASPPFPIYSLANFVHFQHFVF